MVSAKTYIQITGVIFAIVGLVHLYRLLTGMSVALGTWEVPMWGSIVGVIVAWSLAYSAYKLANKKSSRK